MEQTERRKYLISWLLDEQTRYRNIAIPQDEREQRQLLRSLMNIRHPHMKIPTEWACPFPKANYTFRITARTATSAEANLYATVAPIAEDASKINYDTDVSV